MCLPTCVPKNISLGRKYSSEFFNRRGELRHISKLRFWPLDLVLHAKYLFPKPDADALAGFHGPMLRLHPEKCAKASELVHHKWLEAVVVLREFNVPRHAEMEELAGAAGTAVETGGAAHKTAEERVQRTQSEADALKPVEDARPGVVGAGAVDAETEAAAS
ncbi:hypothetical protein B0H17DRAFT_1215081 [Mycena rosella]|uniref:non-specific serine/threonine protein kinase n=1 Tax=Mycena rosella TaxID=1033263 RepID=A0AAD7FZQ3_MYCRO|nr:hypothetical protein B0H17DRAFT_1215081 [Mycena rosella]